MSVERTIYLNSIEPQHMSLRANTGMPTVVNLRFKRHDETPYDIDVAAQVQLLPRSGGPIQTYVAPSTNRPQGFAQFVIPAGEAKDPNGYRLRLVGTYQGMPALLAVGLVQPVEAEGVTAIPEDVIDQIALTIERGGDFILYTRLWQDVAKTIPMDVSNATVGATIEVSADDGTLIANFSVVAGTEPSSFVLTLPQSIVDTLPASCYWRLRFNKAATGTTTLAEGQVTVVEEI